MFERIDMERWERKSHFEYYTTQIKCGYSLTAKLDVTQLAAEAKEQGLGFYPMFLYSISRVVNDTKEFRMGLDAEGNPGYFGEVHPVHTIFHEDDKTFSDIWTSYSPKLSVFYKRLQKDTEMYKDVKGIKTKPDQPQNFFCVSCTPWLHYDGYSTYSTAGSPNLFPIITFGRYEEFDGRLVLPLTVTISHAAADGYHTSHFFNHLQHFIDSALEQTAEK